MQGYNMNSNIATMQNIFDQTMKRNQQFYNNMQSNANGNNLYLNNFNQTWRNFQPNIALNNTNMNNMINILSLINFPVLVPYHGQHPLINCKTPNNAKQFGTWFCGACSQNYAVNVPSFYCTACDYHLCQKCLLSLQAYQIVIYNYLSNMNINPNEKFINSKYTNLNIHEHPMINIQREKTHFYLNLKCNKCKKDLLKDELFYFCSLCNYCVCNKCYSTNNFYNNYNNFNNMGGNNFNNNKNNNANNIVDNPDYLSNNQMKY